MLGLRTGWLYLTTYKNGISILKYIYPPVHYFAVASNDTSFTCASQFCRISSLNIKQMTLQFLLCRIELLFGSVFQLSCWISVADIVLTSSHHRNFSLQHVLFWQKKRVKAVRRQYWFSVDSGGNFPPHSNIKGPLAAVHSEQISKDMLLIFPPLLSILSRQVRYNGIRGRSSVVSLSQTGKVQGGKSMSEQNYHLCLTAGIKLLQSVNIYLSTQSWMAVHRVSKHRGIKISWNI